MSEFIDFCEFILNKTVVHSETATNYTEGIKFFIEINDNTPWADAVTYDSTRQFSIANVSIFELDNEGRCFYEFSVDRNADMISNITFESPNVMRVQLTYYVGGILYTPEELTEFITCASQYHDFKIRITFLDKPNFDDMFKITMRNYIFSNENKQILRNNKVQTTSSVYYNGMCNKKVLY
jgi:hypothetical protein